MRKRPLFSYLTSMKKLLIFAAFASLAACNVPTNGDDQITDSVTSGLIPDTAPDSIQKTQYPDSITTPSGTDSVK